MIHGYRSAEEAAKGSWRQKEAPRGRFATRIPIFEPKDAKWVHSPSEICILILFYTVGSFRVQTSPIIALLHRSKPPPAGTTGVPFPHPRSPRGSAISSVQPHRRYSESGVKETVLIDLIN